MNQLSAADLTASALRTPSAGRIIGTSFSLWMRDLPRFTIIAVIASLPSIAYGYLVAEQGFLAQVIDFVCGGLTSAAVVHGVFKRLAGQGLSLGECFSTALTHLLPVLGASLLIGLALLVTLGFLGFALGMAIGGLAFIPAGLCAAAIYAAYAVTIPALITERSSVLDAMRRSTELTKGSRIKVLAAVFVALLLPSAVGAAYVGLLVNVYVEPSIVQVLEVVLLVVMAAFTALLGVTSAVTYHELRTASEGVSTEALLSVFE